MLETQMNALTLGGGRGMLELGNSHLFSGWLSHSQCAGNNAIRNNSKVCKHSGPVLCATVRLSEPFPRGILRNEFRGLSAPGAQKVQNGVKNESKPTIF